MDEEALVVGQSIVEVAQDSGHLTIGRLPAAVGDFEKVQGSLAIDHALGHQTVLGEHQGGHVGRGQVDPYDLAGRVVPDPVGVRLLDPSSPNPPLTATGVGRSATVEPSLPTHVDRLDGSAGDGVDR
ncbi:hypothetical protein [Streptomyces sp. V4I8]|uniref:hypothetical protein n=1 Tax=Streptomyces sp. V4I8 TaxID=3156469 RepID=UPI0035141448